MKRIILSLVIVAALVMTAVLAANLSPIDADNGELFLECPCETITIEVGNVTNFVSWVSGGDPPYYWSWTVNGEEVAWTQNITYTFDTAGNYTVCVNVTDDSGNKAGPCCRNVTVVGPLLTIVKTGPETVSPGGTLNYTITVTNTGSANATGVTIVDDYDETVLNITDADGGGDDGDTITWKDGINITSGGGFLSYNITATVSPTAPDGYTFNNTANVTCAEGVSDFITIDTMVVAEELYLECPNVPITISVCDDNVIDFVSWVWGGDPPYYWLWTVNGIEDGTTQNITYTFNETGFYIVCVNVTDDSGNKAGPCCRNVTVNPALSLVLSPKTDTNLVGTNHDLTATVTQCGIAMPDVNLNWTIESGPGSFVSKNMTTDADGEAVAVITSGGAGTSMVRCEVAGNTSIYDTATKIWYAEVPPRGGGGGGCPPILDLTVDWEGRNTTERLRANDELSLDLLGLSPDGCHSLLLEQGTNAPIVNGETYYLITIRELELGDIPPLAENTIAILAVSITPTGAVFNKDLILTLCFDQLPENALNVTISYYDGVSGVWVPLESTLGEQDGMLTISAPLRHFTIFAVLAELAPTPTPPPAHFMASGLNIVTSVERIWESVTFVTKTGESVAITANVLNDGGQGGTYTVVLKLDGETVDTEIVTLGAGQSQQVSFTVSGLDYGQHEVEVAGLSGEFITSRTITWWLIIVIIVAIGLIIWGVVWWRRRRRKAHQAA